MKETYTLSPEEFLKRVRIPTRVVASEDYMYEEMTDLTIQTIEKNNKNGEITVVICPVGPTRQYPILAKKINERNVDMKRCWFINMDEYLDDNDQVIPYNSPLSFHATMDREFYTKVNPALLMPKEQRVFPEPGKEKDTDSLIEKLGKVDLCLTAVGINGHIAFNEPALPTDHITDEEYKNLNTRVLDISKETIVNNGANKIYGALDAFPKRCITLGMRQLLKARVFKIYLAAHWQWGIARKISLEKESRFAPASFLQSHSNAEMVISEELKNIELEKVY